MKEYITCSAIWVDCFEQIHHPKNVTNGFVITGHRHCNCIEIFSEMAPMIDGKRGKVSNQGFLTSYNRYVDREEGARIAFEADQIPYKKDILYSEDLY